MKVNVEVTCTPEEARAFFGHDDVGREHQLDADREAEALDRGDDRLGAER